jgi:hypothetical protein
VSLHHADREWKMEKHRMTLNMVKAGIKRIAEDKGVPQRQIIRELKEILEYIGSVIPVIDSEATERDE